MADTHVLVWLGDLDQTPTGISYNSLTDRDRQVGRLVADHLTACGQVVSDDRTWGGYTALTVRLSPPCCPDCHSPDGEPGGWRTFKDLIQAECCDTCGGEQ
jgi:hypothetical protein